MFTGIIEEIGTIRGIKRGNRSVVLEVQAKKVLEDLQVLQKFLQFIQQKKLF